MNCKLTHERLTKALSFDAITGVFHWLISPAKNVKAGAVAGCYKKTGYVLIALDKEQFLGHRLAWFFIHKCWPSLQVDHVNGQRGDNRISNLRLATSSENMQNIYGPAKGNLTGFLGVSPDAKGTAFRASIKVNGVKRHLGTFVTPYSAYQAYIQAKRQFHPRGML